MHRGELILTRLALVSCLALLCLPATAKGQTPDRKRPNLLLILTDQHRGDALGQAGNEAVITPTLDRLAREGWYFPRAYASVPSCTPSRAALLTGRSPWGHGMLGYSRIPDRYPQELPRLLTEAGYRTHAIGKNHFYPQRHPHGYQTIELDESGRVETEGFVSDYRQWFRKQAPDLDPDATGFGWNDYRSGPYALDESLHPTTWTGDRAVAFLAEHEGEKPFFLKVSFARPHSPYDPPQRILDRYRNVKPPAPFVGEWSDQAHGSFHHPERHTAARNNLGAEVTASSRIAYYANVTFLDEQIGRILGALGRHGFLDDTVILFTSDHGDMLGDHHLWRKTYAYEGSARVPFIVWWGEKAGGPPRRRIGTWRDRREVVELRDVVPTLLDAAGLPIPDTVEGRSLLARLRGETEWREFLDLEHATCYWPGNVWTALTDGRIKYIYFAYDGTEQLFDLAGDPGETVNLAPLPAHAKLLEKWRRRMIEHLSPRGEPWVVDGKLGIRKKKILHGKNFPK